MRFYVDLSSKQVRASEVVAQISERGAHDIMQKRARIFFSADSTSGMESLHGVDRLCVCLFVHGVSELFGKRWSIDEYAVDPAEVVQAVACWRSVHGFKPERWAFTKRGVESGLQKRQSPQQIDEMAKGARAAVARHLSDRSHRLLPPSQPQPMDPIACLRPPDPSPDGTLQWSPAGCWQRCNSLALRRQAALLRRRRMHGL